MILLIDNYDSFVFNLARYVGELGYTRKVVRNDVMTVAEIKQLQPSHIIISPGPCTPDEAGISLQVIRECGPYIPILGICLGHQAIGQAYGGQVGRARVPMHGKASLITHDKKNLFRELPNPLTVGRYHSLIVTAENFPAQLIVTASSLEGEIMGLAHSSFPVVGVQFHPESVLTQHGHALLSNFLHLKTGSQAQPTMKPAMGEDWHYAGPGGRDYVPCKE